jgi:hypothetical protein
MPVILPFDWVSSSTPAILELREPYTQKPQAPEPSLKALPGAIDSEHGHPIHWCPLLLKAQTPTTKP